MGAASSLEVDELRDLKLEDALVKEDDRARGLVLRGGGDAALHGEVVEEGGHLRCAQVAGLAVALEGDEGGEPQEARLFRARRALGAESLRGRGRGRLPPPCSDPGVFCARDPDPGSESGTRASRPRPRPRPRTKAA
jgi:hypothetical protein